MKYAYLLGWLWICPLLSPLSLVAQEKITVTGRVMDMENEKPLAGATVILQNEEVGTVTDDEGYFVLFTDSRNLPLTLIVSDANYATKKVRVQGSTDVLIVRLRYQSL